MIVCWLLLALDEAYTHHLPITYSKETVMSQTYLTTAELSARIKYDSRTIREHMKDSVLLEGVHYIRPFGGRKILYVWEVIERDMKLSSMSSFAIPMANGGVLNG
jgi:hypothetical protein